MNNLELNYSFYLAGALAGAITWFDFILPELKAYMTERRKLSQYITLNKVICGVNSTQVMTIKELNAEMQSFQLPVFDIDDLYNSPFLIKKYFNIEDGKIKCIKYKLITKGMRCYSVDRTNYIHSKLPKAKDSSTLLKVTVREYVYQDRVIDLSISSIIYNMRENNCPVFSKEDLSSDDITAVLTKALGWHSTDFTILYIDGSSMTSSVVYEATDIDIEL